MLLLTRLTLWLCGLGFIGFGVACLIAPIEVLASAGVIVSGSVAAAEMRAFYGGLELGLGSLIIAAAVTPDHRRAGLWLCLAAYGGIGTARALGMLIDGVSSPFLWFALATELGFALLAGICLLRGSKMP